MGTWYLSFADTTTVTLDAAESVLRAAVGEAVEIRRGELSGNPRDYYSREVLVIARSPVEALRVEVRFLETVHSPSDEGEPYRSFGGVSVCDESEAPFAMKLAVWHALREAFAALGCSDRTVPSATMIEDAEGAGTTEIATTWRANVTQHLLAQARMERRSIYLSGEPLAHPGDLDAILAAYPDPASITSITLSYMRLATLPANLARFPNVEQLGLHETELDPAELVAIAMPKVTRLRVSIGRLERLTKADLAGFPELGHLGVESCPLVRLEPSIIDACPKLYRVSLIGTPLAKDAASLAKLYARWPGVHTWDLRH